MISKSQQKLSNFRRGELGEQLAVEYLTASGFVLMDQNVVFGKHEVDAVMLDSQYNEVVFVEVKLRSSDEQGHPSEAVKFKKICSLRAVAQSYMRIHHLTNDFRCDLITVTARKVEHFENITW